MQNNLRRENETMTYTMRKAKCHACGRVYLFTWEEPEKGCECEKEGEIE
jgi:hypothetical protein